MLLRLDVAAWALFAPLLSAQFTQRVTEVDVPVAAVDRYDHLVTSLRRSDLAVFDNGRERPITSLLLEEGPASVIILADVSGSMKKELPFVQSAVEAILRRASPDDEFALLEFSDKAEMTVPFSTSETAVAARLNFLRAEGRTSLLDAIAQSVEHIKAAKHQRRALIVVSDGEDTNSRHKAADVVRLVMESNARVYSIELNPAMGDGWTGDSILRRVADLSGGRYFATYSPKSLATIVDRIDVHRFYRLAFQVSTDEAVAAHRIDLRWTPKSRPDGVRLFWRRTYEPEINRH